MKGFINYLIVLLIVSTFAGCSDYLDIEPQGLRFEENFYSNKDEVFEGLMAAYDFLGQRFSYDYTYHSSYMIRNIASDDANTGGGNALDMLDWQKVDEYSVTPSNVSNLGHWWRSYFGIYRCNQIITRVDPGDPELHVVPADSILLKTYVAEAKFLRAYYYWELVTFFGGVPLVDRLIDVSEDYPPRATVEETWAFIGQDLLDAIPDLPLKSEQDPANYHRASRGAAQALLGKAYIFQEKYTEAAGVYEDIITSGEYDLAPDYAGIFTVEGEFGPGSIFEISHSNKSPADWEAPFLDGVPTSRGFEGNVDCQMMGIRELSGSSVYRAGWGFNKAEMNLVNLFLSEGDTTRMNASIYSTDSIKAQEGGNVTWNADYKYTGWYCDKYAPKNSNRGDGIGSPELDYNVNERVIRYADILLLAAEAHMMKPGPDEATARDYINEVRNRVGRPDLDPGLSGPDLFDAYVLERRLELAMEGHRYFDLIRWGMAEDVLVNQPQATSVNKGSFTVGVNEYFPIPLQEIERSGNVLEQNPGY